MTKSEKHLAGHAAKGILESGGGNKGAERRLQLALIGLLAFVLAEAVRVMTRQNFGRNGITVWRLWVCCILFISIGLLGVFADESVFGGSYVILFGFAVVYEGYKKRAQAVDDSDYQGDYNEASYESKLMATPESILGRLLGKHNPIIGDRNLYLVFEPGIYVAIGAIACFFSLWVGVVYILCGLSVWGEMLCLSLFDQTPTEKADAKVQQMNARIDPTYSDNEVVLD